MTAPDEAVPHDVRFPNYHVDVGGRTRVLMHGDSIAIQTVLALFLPHDDIANAMAYLERRRENLGWIQLRPTQNSVCAVSWQGLESVLRRTCRFVKRRDRGEEFINSKMFLLIVEKAQQCKKRDNRSVVAMNLQRALANLVKCNDHAALLAEHPDVAPIVHALSGLDHSAIFAAAPSDAQVYESDDETEDE